MLLALLAIAVQPPFLFLQCPEDVVAPDVAVDMIQLGLILVPRDDFQRFHIPVPLMDIVKPSSASAASDEEIIVILQVVVGGFNPIEGRLANPAVVLKEDIRNIGRHRASVRLVEYFDKAFFKAVLERMYMDLLAVNLKDIATGALKDGLHTEVIECVGAVDRAVHYAENIQCPKAAVQHQHAAVDEGPSITAINGASVTVFACGINRTYRLVDYRYIFLGELKIVA